MITKTSNGVQTCNASTVVKEKIKAACYTKSLANAAPISASCVVNLRISPAIAQLQSSGMLKQVLSQKMLTGSQQTRKYAHSAVRTLKRTRDATI